METGVGLFDVLVEDEVFDEVDCLLELGVEVVREVRGPVLQEGIKITIGVY